MLYRIYRIYSPIEPNGLCYIGQTKQKYLNQRLRQHRNEYRYKDTRRSCKSSQVFDKYGIENCIINVLEEIECEDKLETDKKEKQYIELFENCVNKNIPAKQYKEYKKEYRKEYYEINKEQLIKYREEYNKQKIFCNICNCEIKKQSLSHHKLTKKHLNNLQQN